MFYMAAPNDDAEIQERLLEIDRQLSDRREQRSRFRRTAIPERSTQVTRRLLFEDKDSKGDPGAGGGGGVESEG
jgi:hypothetical protein